MLVTSLVFRSLKSSMDAAEMAEMNKIVGTWENSAPIQRVLTRCDDMANDK